MEEGFNISSDIFDKRLTLQLKWEEFAVLYRTNAQSRIFEETLRRKNIPYKIYGGLSFYERKEIKDILAYFKMVVNPEDEEALKRSINYPKRGIGDTSIRKILELAAISDTSAWSIITETEKLPPHFNSGTIWKLSTYTDLINTLSLGKDQTDAYSKAREIVFGSGIMKELRDGKMPEEISRYENMEELLNGIKAFTEAAETNGEPSTLEAYLANVALLTDQDNEKEKIAIRLPDDDAFCQGLEFNYVYIVGMEVPCSSPMSTGSSRELERGKKLFMLHSQARKQVILSYALNRYKWETLKEVIKPVSERD